MKASAEITDLLLHKNHLAVFNFHGKLGELYVFIEVIASRAAIVFPRMPGTNNGVSMQRAFSNGSGGVRTDAVQHVNFAIDVA